MDELSLAHLRTCWTKRALSRLVLLCGVKVSAEIMARLVCHDFLYGSGVLSFHVPT